MPWRVSGQQVHLNKLNIMEKCNRKSADDKVDMKESEDGMGEEALRGAGVPGSSCVTARGRARGKETMGRKMQGGRSRHG
ncbi:Protein lin-28 like B, partial [Dissostichus eleginoides]